MARALDVYLYQQLVGRLIQDERGQMVFDYAESWLQNKNAIALSYSLPLRKKRFSCNECRAFFAGILPEGNKRAVIASESRIINFKRTEIFHGMSEATQALLSFYWYFHASLILGCFIRPASLSDFVSKPSCGSDSQ